MWKFIRFEWARWFTSPMLWIFLLINALLIFGAVSSDQITIGGGVGSVYKNAPSVIQSYYAVMSLICLLMTTAFMNATANRDFSTGMDQFIFSSPIKKRDYFFGKFIGAASVALIPLLGVSIGALIGPYMPWVQPERYGPVIWSGHIQGILAFAIPNTIITAVITYSLAVLFRNNMVSFVGSMLILVFYLVSSGFTRDLEKEWLANLIDPFGFQPFSTYTKYLTVEEKNASPTMLEGQFLLNRLLWIGISLLALLGMYTRFSFNTKKEKVRKKQTALLEEHTQALVVPKMFNAQMHRVKPTALRTFWHMAAFESKAIIKNQTFLILLIIGMINLITGVTSFTGNYGASQYPVTYDVVDTIRGSFYLFLIGIITFYSGVLVWKERDVKISEIEDATPVSTGLLFLSKLTAMMVSVFLVLCCTIVVGMVAQLAYGYTRVELDVYIKSLLVLDMLKFGFLVVIALLFHYLINNRYLAYFAFVAFLILNLFLWSALEVSTNMVQYGATPSVTYSDMNGFGPFIPGLVWFNVYWGLFAILVGLVTYAFYVRGKELSFNKRLSFAASRLAKSRLLLVSVSVLFLLCGGFVYYNTEVLNTYLNPKKIEERAKAYELNYRQYEGLAQPRWVALEYQIDIHPYERDLFAKVQAKLVNKSGEAIPELHFTMPSMPDSVGIHIAGATLRENNKALNYRIYSLATPMQPGDTLAIEVTVSKVTKGFENEVMFTSLTQNGTFFNQGDILPTLGYDKNYEIRDKNKRKKLGLPERVRLNPLNEDDLASRQNSYISNDADWVTIRTVIATAPDQIAVAPGSLVKQWEENNRAYFEYHIDHISLNFYSFISARYEVAREKWEEVDLEVYYIKGHEYNVPNMLKSMRKSLEYYTQNFGPYYHKQCRIIEFPRYASFAQAFPGTMPYSEGVGFIVDLRKVTDDDIDLVFYIVAHEMAHQYWAHQLIGASMRGTEMMSESFAQYSSLMVMEKEYGRDKMNKFLKYEMDGYLRGRGGEFEAERPLAETENQGYIHYNKGSVVMYYLKEMIGEDSVNKALQQLIVDHAYKEPPYPTSLSAVRAFREVTPDSLQYLIDDLFENITLFSNRVVEATYQQKGDLYEVTITTLSEKFRADTLGKQQPVPLDDYIDIGVFAQTDNKNILGKPLVYERRKVQAKENTFVFTVAEKPFQAGIDPYYYLVDRIPDDNVKKVTLP